MTKLSFKGINGHSTDPASWLAAWRQRYPEDDYSGYEELLSKHDRLTSHDFERIGRWKDAAQTDAKWKPNTASVAFPIWMQAAEELPSCPQNDEGVVAFLHDWSERSYVDQFQTKAVTKRFGLSRSSTLLHFLSGGKYPIFDSRVRRALARMSGATVPNTVDWYMHSYCPLIEQIATECGTTDLRVVDKALFSYGDKAMPWETNQ